MEKVEFPKFKFHASKPAQLVKTKDEESSLGTEWKNSPRECGAPESHPGFITPEDLSRKEVEAALAAKASKKSQKDVTK